MARIFLARANLKNQLMSFLNANKNHHLGHLEPRPLYFLLHANQSKAKGWGYPRHWPSRAQRVRDFQQKINLLYYEMIKCHNGMIVPLRCFFLVNSYRCLLSFSKLDCSLQIFLSDQISFLIIWSSISIFAMNQLSIHLFQSRILAFNFCRKLVSKHQTH